MASFIFIINALNCLYIINNMKNRYYIHTFIIIYICMFQIEEKSANMKRSVVDYLRNI